MSKKKTVEISDGNYMSVNREESLKENWDKVQGMTRPGSNKVDYDNDPFYAGEKPQESISIPEMFRHMWTQDAETAYPINSPEFLRIT